jgi:hypothetical protein
LIPFFFSSKYVHEAQKKANKEQENPRERAQIDLMINQKKSQTKDFIVLLIKPVRE